MIEILIFLALAGVIAYFFLRNRPAKREIYEEVPARWKQFLQNKIAFYASLEEERKKQFERDVQLFLSDVKITGVQTDVTVEDRLLVASSAVIPLFGFPSWNYQYLDEVLLYPSSFDRNYVIGSKEEIITGMVGTGAMEGKMILSKPALHHGFTNAQDKRNVGIHEFVHLFDKEDGLIDGIPPGFEEKKYALPWVNFVREKTREIVANQSDINGYATTNRQEFFAVASEYFFERPKLLKKKHPELYQILTKVFKQELVDTLDTSITIKTGSVGRNQPCPCGSGKKYKRCCLG